MKPIKVAVIRPAIHTIDEQFCHFLAKDGFVVTLIAPKKSISTPNKMYHPNFKVKLLSTLKYHFLDGYPIILQLYSYLKKERFDVVQASEDFHFITWISALYCRLNAKRLIPFEDRYFFPRHSMDYVLYQIFRRLFFRFVWNTSSTIVCRSKAAFIFMRRIIGSQYIKKLTILTIGVNTVLFHPIYKKRKRNSLRLLTIARFITHKDYPTLIKAIHHLKASKRIPIALTIVGKGSLYKTIKQQICDYNLQNEIKIIKHIPYKKLKYYYSQHNLFVLPSVVESNGSVILEAMACGLPVIISNVGGMLDFVKDGKNGYIFQVGDYKDLADKIIQLKDIKKRGRFGQESLKLVREKFDWSILIKKYANVIAE